MPPRPNASQRSGSGSTISVYIPSPLQKCCRGASELSLRVETLGALLNELERRYPALHQSICDETGTVRRHINLFVNHHHMRDLDGLETQLAEADVVTIMTAVSGG